MMKKSFCLLLCVVLLCTLFAGCAKEPPAATGPPTTEPVSTEKGGSLSFSLDALPEIGGFAPIEKRESFFPDGPHDTFEPRDDYGEVVPYCAKSGPYFDASGRNAGEAFSAAFSVIGAESYYVTYGFATGDGKIITDGIYDNVYWMQNQRGDGFYSASREQPGGMESTEDLIAPDGSWRLHFDYVANVDVMADRCHSEPAMFMISTQQTAVLYNYQGEKVLDVPACREEDGHSQRVLYVDSDALLVESIDWETNEPTYTLFDYDGNVRARLPEAVKWVNDAFSGGVLLVDVENEQKQLTDLSGKPLCEPYFEMEYSAQDDCFLARTGDGDRQTILFLDKQGKKLKTLDLDYTFVNSYDGYVWLYDETTRTFYDFDGSPTVMDADGQEIVKVHDILSDWSIGRATYYYYAETANGELYVFDTSGTRIQKWKDVHYTAYDLENSQSEKQYDLFCDNGFLYCLQNDALKLTDLASGKTHTIPLESPERYSWTNILNGRMVAVYTRLNDVSYHVARDVYDMETGNVLFKDVVFEAAFGNYALVATKTENILLDNTATPLVRLQNDDLV